VTIFNPDMHMLGKLDSAISAAKEEVEINLATIHELTKKIEIFESEGNTNLARLFK
jgi:hypothetical protein